MLKNKVIVLSNILEIEIFELDKREVMEDGYKFAGVINKDGELLENFEGSGNFATPSCVEIYLLEYIYRNKLVTITKDNIHLYYEFMSDKDKNIYHNLIWTLLVERYKFIIKTLSLCDFQVGVGFFKVKDTLKPLEEYIKDIKESSEYKEYVFREFYREYDLDKNIYFTTIPEKDLVSITKYIKGQGYRFREYSEMVAVEILNK